MSSMGADTVSLVPCRHDNDDMTTSRGRLVVVLKDGAQIGWCKNEAMRKTIRMRGGGARGEGEEA